jgi:hypothetical protein
MKGKYRDSVYKYGGELALCSRIHIVKIYQIFTNYIDYVCKAKQNIR